jgi:hypothetical protein
MLILTAVQQAKYTVSFVDQRGNPAPVEGIPIWAAQDAAILTLEADADGMGCLVKAVGLVGTSQVSVQADADLGEGTVLVVATDSVQVVAAMAVGASMSAGTPEDQPTA